MKLPRKILTVCLLLVACFALGHSDYHQALLRAQLEKTWAVVEQLIMSKEEDSVLARSANSFEGRNALGRSADTSGADKPDRTILSCLH